MIITVNPTDGTTLATYGVMTPEQLENVAIQAAQAAAEWGCVPVGERLEALTRLASELRTRADELAALITAEMGTYWVVG